MRNDEFRKFLQIWAGWHEMSIVPADPARAGTWELPLLGSYQIEDIERQGTRGYYVVDNSTPSTIFATCPTLESLSEFLDCLERTQYS